MHLWLFAGVRAVGLRELRRLEDPGEPQFKPSDGVRPAIFNAVGVALDSRAAASREYLGAVHTAAFRAELARAKGR